MVRRRDAPVGGALSEGAQAKIQSKNSLSPITPLVRVTFSKEVMEGIFSVTPRSSEPQRVSTTWVCIRMPENWAKAATTVGPAPSTSTRKRNALKGSL